MLVFTNSVGVQSRSMKLKPPAETFDFKRKFIGRAKVLYGRKYAEAHWIKINCNLKRGEVIISDSFFSFFIHSKVPKFAFIFP